jgi:AraC-like DNA-binding protein
MLQVVFGIIDRSTPPRYQESDHFVSKPAADLTINLTAVERLLGQTSLVALGEFRCPVRHAQFAGGGPQSCHYIVFPRNPVRIQMHGGDCEVASAGTLRFYNEGDSYDRAAVGGRPDESDWIALNSQLLDDLLARSCRLGSSCQSKMFPARSAPVSARLCLWQRRLFAFAAREQPYSRLALEEAGIACASRAIHEATHYWNHAKSPRRAPRRLSQRRRAQIAEQTKEILALDPALELSIADLAARVHCSVAHLARVFVAHTGRSLHAFRQQIRLHYALDLLASGGSSLADIALQAGYASHSHMTQALRRGFGFVPSRLRTTVMRNLESPPVCR